MSEASHHQPPIALFLKVWGLLFVLSFFSYLVDYYQVQGGLRWTLVIFFMILKAGVIIAVFMHVKWERLSLKLLLGLPTLAILVFVLMMAIEADYIQVTRLTFFS